MIVCVTLNPCLDKTLTAPSWKPGDLVRGKSVRNVVGGKGNNVARALKRLGRTARPLTPLGGPTGEVCRELLEKTDELDPIIVETKEPTRVILTVLTEDTTRQTAFFDPDPQIDATEADAILNRLEQVLAEPGVEALTLSGSSPSPATHGLYSEMISLAIGRRLPVFLDTYGPALESIWGFWPTVIQVNRHEAAGLLDKATASDDDVLGLLHEWDRRGVICGVVTDGPDEVFIQYKGQRYAAEPADVEVVNPIGSGDSFLAGLVDGWLANRDPEALIRRAMACAAANASVWDSGAIEPDLVAQLEEEIEIEAL